MSASYKYDVAFSFLQRDEPLALQLNDLLQDRVKTFIYPERQKELAGTDGEETFGKVFGEEARLAVVLYRSEWGETKWTRVEQTAIRRRGFEHGYSFAKFIPLGEPPEVPPWLPPTQVWIGLKRFGIEAAAAVIEARIAELGGQPHQETVEEHAARLERSIQFEARREKFQWDEGVQAAKQEVTKLKEALESRSVTVRRASSIQLSVIQARDSVYLIGLGRALEILWKQKAGNHLDGAYLHATLFSHQPAGPGQWNLERPKQIRSMRFQFDLLPSEVGGWNDAIDALLAPMTLLST